MDYPGESLETIVEGDVMRATVPQALWLTHKGIPYQTGRTIDAIEISSTRLWNSIDSNRAFCEISSDIV